MDTLELKIGEKIIVVNGACMEAEIKENLPRMSDKVGNESVEILRDSGCNGVIIKRKLLDKSDFTGEMRNMMTEKRMLIRSSIARIKLDPPFYTETVEAICIKDP